MASRVILLSKNGTFATYLASGRSIHASLRNSLSRPTNCGNSFYHNYATIRCYVAKNNQPTKPGLKPATLTRWRPTSLLAELRRYRSAETQTAPSNVNKNAQSEQELGEFNLVGLTEKMQRRLRVQKKIDYLFPVQYLTYQETVGGQDVIVQARTGTGKTLSFAIPLIEILEGNPDTQSRRKPRVLVLEPTRELANQVTDDFVLLGGQLASVPIYGGVSYDRQTYALNAGVDVVVGTPGRLYDMMNRGQLSVDGLEHIVVDEVDRLLDMGFAPQVEQIIKSCYERANKPQTLMYSATMPAWVLKTARKYMTNNYSHVNLIGKHEAQTATSVEHYAVRTQPNSRTFTALLKHLLETYSPENGQAMIFSKTKTQANMLAYSFPSTLGAVLHGDVSQRQRSRTLAEFKNGRIKVLFTTDVSARGLDIPNVDLIIQCEPPEDSENYIHRSGRTGRAGKPGVSICLYTPQQAGLLHGCARIANIEFEDLPVPELEENMDGGAGAGYHNMYGAQNQRRGNVRPHGQWRGGSADRYERTGQFGQNSYGGQRSYRRTGFGERHRDGVGRVESSQPYDFDDTHTNTGRSDPSRDYTSSNRGYRNDSSFTGFNDSELYSEDGFNSRDSNRDHRPNRGGYGKYNDGGYNRRGGNRNQFRHSGFTSASSKPKGDSTDTFFDDMMGDDLVGGERDQGARKSSPGQTDYSRYLEETYLKEPK